MFIQKYAYVSLWVLSLSVIQSCLPQRKSSSTSEAVSSNLTISGVVSTGGGKPAANVDVYLDTAKDPTTKTGTDGAFKIDVDSAKLSAIQNTLPSTRSTWNIYFKQPGTITLVGSSAAISVQQRGSFDTGTITLQPASSVKGKVLFAAGNLINPGVGALVTIGREQAIVNADGSFTLTELNSGSVVIHAEASKYQSANESITLSPGSDVTRDDPVVLFQGTNPTAVLLLQPYFRDPKGLANPTTRTFKVKASPNTKFIRYYHSLIEMERLPTVTTTTTTDATNAVNVQVNTNNSNVALTQWREVPDIINYSFPTEGPAVLWYQAADSAIDIKSDLLSVTTNINSCEGLALILGDGSGISTSRKTKITLSGLPSNAVRVRFTEDPSVMKDQPWHSATPSFDIALSSPVPSSSSSYSDQLVSQATRQVFVEVATTSGFCPVVNGTIALQPFPNQNQMVVINGGAVSTPSRIVQVDIPTLPPNAFEMKLFEISPSASSSNGTASSITNMTPWLRAVPRTSFMFQSTGTRILGVQFRDIDGLVSSNYTAAIDVIQSQLAGFTISFSQISNLSPVIPTPPSRYLVLQVMPPPNALAFRYLEIVGDGNNSNLGGTSTSGISTGAAPDASYLAAQPWLNLIPLVPVYSRGIGLRTFVMQFQTLDGITSTMTQSIFIDQVPATIGDFVINSGEVTTMFPTVQLNVLPPVDAVAMSATNLTLQQTTANSSTVFTQGTTTQTTSVTNNDQWLSIVPKMDFKLDGRGTQTVQIRFRDPNGNVATPAVAHSIIYDPFPPFPPTVTPLSINNGAASTTSALVTLNILAPMSAHSFRASLDPDFAVGLEYQEIPNTAVTVPLAGVTWTAFSFNAPFIITGDPGPKIIYVEFRNELGDRSASLTSSITYSP